MKTMLNNRVIALALVALFTVAFAAPTFANDDKKVIPVELKFIGKVQNQPIFHLNFNGAEENTYTIIIRDEYSNVLYKEVVKGGTFTKKYLLNTEEVGDTDLKFEITSRSYEKPVVFTVNKQSRFVEDVVVNKAN